MKRILTIFPLLLAAFVVASQDSTQIKLTYNQERISETEIRLVITAHVKAAGIELFGLQTPQNKDVFSAVVFDTAARQYLKDSLTEKGSLVQHTDAVLNVPVSFVKDSVQWAQSVTLKKGDSAVVKGATTYMYKAGDSFASFEEPFKFYVKNEEVKAAAGETTGPGTNKSLLWIFLTAFAGGLLALLTPCVYSMIPITVSFFTKRSKTKTEGIRNALVYSLSIIVIFTLLGFFITVIFGPDALNKLATNWIANLVFFLVFLIFGISFLGAFEIALPSSWGTRADSRANTQSLLGIFFMALTLVVVSFSCTGPIIGNLLVLASKGSRMGPLVGMFGFSLALALPFALFAFFPSKLNMLGKAGGWLNAVKVTLGFLELALALKFLSNADLTQNWRILDREIFIVLWVVIFFLLGLYLLGKLKFRHDDELPRNDFGLPHLSVTRLFFAIASFSMVMYLVPGLWGAPLKGLSAFLPPMGTQDFNADDLPSGFDPKSMSSRSGSEKDTVHFREGLPAPVKYVAVMKKHEPDVVVNNGLVTYFDYQEALDVARKVKKPLMLDFTGVNCINCRLMEGQVWSDPAVMQRLKNDFVIASLFTDVHNGVDIPVGEQYYSKSLGKQVETLGEKNSDLQVSRYGSLVQPLYFFLDEDEQLLAAEGYPYIPSVSKFVAHLDRVIAEYRKRNP
ncbi:protein-disulfide reductase DsbD family protein [Niabella drilacis]|uniref:Thiol:disulfide interchange protein DsbD n=1 Tax=Niabella drilacis (strain DSM 25811 / CCM 8410 / CCUG 62505 / LMG 26954 / E90) TaxID=1285928 RepID=A0A1G6UZ60_NIADE|nr:thioredoxin family protein [Niabella drilacis]SDD46690.1 thiol:disulfide interchange protein DsbD [Niabella drilacis]